MPAFDEALGDTWNPLSQNDGWLLKLQPVAPKLCEALEGEAGWEKDRSKRPPLTVMIMDRDGKLKFQLSNPTWDRSYWGQISDASDVVASLEMALASNQGEWVKKRGDGSGSGRRA